MQWQSAVKYVARHAEAGQDQRIFFVGGWWKSHWPHHELFFAHDFAVAPMWNHTTGVGGRHQDRKPPRCTRVELILSMLMWMPEQRKNYRRFFYARPCMVVCKFLGNSWMCYVIQVATSKERGTIVLVGSWLCLGSGCYQGPNESNLSGGEEAYADLDSCHNIIFS